MDFGVIFYEIMSLINVNVDTCETKEFLGQPNILLISIISLKQNLIIIGN